MCTIRQATPQDAEVILGFIQALAEYEREPQEVQVTAEMLRAQLASKPPPFECLIADHEDAPAGFALFFPTYSTWRGRPGIWLEDLFVLPEKRRFGIGRALLRQVAVTAVERGCARLEWSVLDWNQLAIDFYQTLGAIPMSEWTTFRLSDDALADLAS